MQATMMKTWITVLPFGVFTLSVAVSSQQPCSICIDRADAITFPDKEFNMAGIPVETCQDLSNMAPLVTSDNAFCLSIQSMGPFCGCPIPSEACHLCSGGSPVPETSKQLQSHPANRYIAGAPPGVPMTCETMESVLYMQQRNGTEQCKVFQGSAGVECGCPVIDNVFEENQTAATLSPSTSPAPSGAQPAMCSVCINGEDISLPDKALDLGDLPIETCADLDRFAVLLPMESEQCIGLQSIGTLCGCSPPHSSYGCTLCPHGEAPSRPRKHLKWISEGISSRSETYSQIGESLTYETFDASLQTLSPETEGLYGANHNLICLGAQVRSWNCGCKQDWRPIVLTWGYRISATCSLLVSYTESN